jgi:hypothetical protein
MDGFSPNSSSSLLSAPLGSSVVRHRHVDRLNLSKVDEDLVEKRARL